MAINIPNKAFHSFTFKQCVNALYRSGQQIDQAWEKQESRSEALKILKGNLDSLELHEEQQVQVMAKRLLGKFPVDQVTMQEWLMDLEQVQSMDLKDSDFLVSTVDDFAKENTNPFPIHLVLDNLRSSFNVGSLLRTAEALGIEEVHLCGYTPTPENAKTSKSALGTDEWIKWTYWESTLECLDQLKEKGVNLYAFETEKNAVDINECKAQFPAALVLGNERFGLASPVLKRADELLKISLHGKKNSLNVATCGAIALNHFVSRY